MLLMKTWMVYWDSIHIFHFACNSRWPRQPLVERGRLNANCRLCRNIQVTFFVSHSIHSEVDLLSNIIDWMRIVDCVAFNAMGKSIKCRMCSTKCAWSTVSHSIHTIRVTLNSQWIRRLLVNPTTSCSRFVVERCRLNVNGLVYRIQHNRQVYITCLMRSLEYELPFVSNRIHIFREFVSHLSHSKFDDFLLRVI